MVVPLVHRRRRHGDSRGALRNRGKRQQQVATGVTEDDPAVNHGDPLTLLERLYLPHVDAGGVTICVEYFHRRLELDLNALVSQPGGHVGTVVTPVTKPGTVL